MKSVLQNVGTELLRLPLVIAALICPNNGTFLERSLKPVSPTGLQTQIPALFAKANGDGI